MIYPVPKTTRITQTYAEHVARAKSRGWCPMPGNCPSKIYYFGGIDWGCPNGTKVKAALGGVVSVARADGSGYGLHLRIQSEQYLLIYGHLQKLFVSVGQTVQEGDVIALSDNTGNSTGPHLHFEVRLNGKPIDPLPLLTDAKPQPGPAPEPPPVSLPTFPVLPRARTLEMMNVRTGPGIGNDVNGSLNEGEDFEVIRAIVEGLNVWLQFGKNQFVAYWHEGKYYVKFTEDPQS